MPDIIDVVEQVAHERNVRWGHRLELFERIWVAESGAPMLDAARDTLARVIADSLAQEDADV